MRRGRAGVSALPVMALVLAAGGCSSDAEPSPMPTPSWRPSEAVPESSTPTPPAMPAEASGTTPAAAKAFVRHYFDQINYAALTGDTAPLRALSTDDCESCDAIASNVERIYGDGGHIESAGWQLTLIRFVHRSNGVSTLSLGVRMSREHVVGLGGDVEVNDTVKQPMTIRILTRGKGSLVQQIDLVT